MSQYSTNQPGSGRNTVIGKVFGTIGSIIGFFAVLSAIGNIGRAAVTAASVSNVSNKASVQDTKQERTTISRNSWEEQEGLARSYKAEEPILKLAESIKYLPIDIERENPNLTRLEIKRAEPFIRSERFAKKVISEQYIPRIKEPQFILDDDFHMQPNVNINADLSSLLRSDKIVTEIIPTKHKTLRDIEMENYWGIYSEYQSELPRTSLFFQRIAKSRMQKQYGSDDNNLTISTTQDISDSLQVDETDFASVNIAEENVIDELNNNVFENDTTFTELEKYDVTPQILDTPMNVKVVIPDKIIAW